MKGKKEASYVYYVLQSQETINEMCFTLHSIVAVWKKRKKLILFVENNWIWFCM